MESKVPLEAGGAQRRVRLGTAQEADSNARCVEARAVDRMAADSASVAAGEHLKTELPAEPHGAIETHREEGADPEFLGLAFGTRPYPEASTQRQAELQRRAASPVKV